MNETNTIQGHYDVEDLRGKFERTLKDAGLDDSPVEWSKLAPFDQFHVRGFTATKELGEALHPAAGSSVLDVGSGFGGPARFLAATYGCHVTGIDLTPSYVEVAKMLSERAGLSDRLTFVQGDATQLPFSPEEFDDAWTQHVSMNIEDKARFYGGIYRVLRPGGRFAIYDICRGESGPVHYPVPWARDASLSFLASPEEMQGQLRDAGFNLLSVIDTTEVALSWFAMMQSAQGSSGGTPPNPAAILGPLAGQMGANAGQSIKEGHLCLVQIIAQKA